MKLFWFMSWIKLWLVQNQNISLDNVDNVDGFVKDFYGTKYLELYGPEKHVIFNSGRYFIGLKSGIT